MGSESNPDETPGTRDATTATGEVSASAETKPLERHAVLQDLSIIGRKIGSYSIKSEIASGGMGTVYVAVQESPHREVALKVMKRGVASRAALRRFEFESQILARLRHPNVAQVYEAGTHDDGEGGVPYFAMEYIPDARLITEYAAAKAVGGARGGVGTGGSRMTLAFSPEGTRLASAGYGFAIQLWDASSGEELDRFEGNFVRGLGFSTDGLRAVHSREFTRAPPALWNISSSEGGTPLGRRNRSGELVVAFSIDGERVATTLGRENVVTGMAPGPPAMTGRPSIRIWDASSGEELATVRGQDFVSAVALSPSGTRIASGSKEGTISLWDIPREEEVLTLRGHGSEVWSIAFSPDGTRLASADSSGTIRLWDGTPR